MRAILVVDVNRGCGWSFEKDEKEADRRKFISNLKELLKKEREKGTKIIFTIWPKGRFSGQEFFVQPSSRLGLSRCVPCKNGEMADFLDHRHDKETYEPVFFKGGNDAFTNEELEKYLRANGVTEIALAGCYNWICICSTAKGAFRSGFNVVLFKDYVYPSFCDDDEARSWVSVVGEISFDPSLSVAVE